MNGRTGIFKFFIFILLLVIILFQVLSMIQADRLYGRLDDLIKHLQSVQRPRPMVSGGGPEQSAEDFATAKGAADEGDWLVYHDSGEPRTLNPISVEGSMESRHVYSRNILETLFYYDLDYEGLGEISGDRL